MRMSSGRENQHEEDGSKHKLRYKDKDSLGSQQKRPVVPHAKKNAFTQNYVSYVW